MENKNNYWSKTYDAAEKCRTIVVENAKKLNEELEKIGKKLNLNMEPWYRK